MWDWLLRLIVSVMAVPQGREFMNELALAILFGNRADPAFRKRFLDNAAHLSAATSDEETRAILRRINGKA